MVGALRISGPWNCSVASHGCDLLLIAGSTCGRTDRLQDGEPAPGWLDRLALFGVSCFVWLTPVRPWPAAWNYCPRHSGGDAY